MAQIGRRSFVGDLAVVACLVLAWGPREASAQVCPAPGFGSPTSIGVGVMPVAVAVSDFNEDGVFDLAVANGSANTVSILLGNGLGGFSFLVNLPVTGPTAIAVADFDGDGHADLAVTNASTVVVQLGTGAGGFGSASSFGSFTTVTAVVAGDFNGDAITDLAVAHGSGVSILLGTGTGGFGAAITSAAGTNPRALAVGDFNADGKLDVVVANQGSSNVSVLLGAGNGGLGAAVNFATGTQPVSVAIGDFNGDAKLDLAVANQGSGNVSVLLGAGNGSFGAATNFAAGTQPASVAVGDFNRDGRADLAVANFSSNNVSTLRGTGAGGFNAAVNVAVGSGPDAVLVADFNRDGMQDLVVVNQTANSVSILSNVCVPPGVADGTFEQGSPWPAWTVQTSGSFTTPLCDTNLCSGGAQGAVPDGGRNWAWFGGAFSLDVDTLGQSLTLPVSSDLRLRFRMKISFVTAPPTDTLTVKVDGTLLQTFVEPSSPESAYTTREVNVTAFANGGTHALLFTYTHPDVGVANFNVDNVELVPRLVDLAITNTDQRTTAPSGAFVTYMIKATNNGPTALTGATVTDTFPPAIVSVSWTCTATSGSACGAASGSGNISQAVDLLPGGSARYVAVALINAAATGTLSNTATVAVPAGVPSTFADPVPANNTATDIDTLLPAANLSITKTDGQKTATPGQLLTYTIVASNAGSNLATGATVTDNVPSSLTGATWTCAGAGGGTCGAAGGSGNISETVNLPVTGSVTYMLSGTVVANPTSVQNRATITVPPTVADPNLADNTATDVDFLVCGGDKVVVPDGRITSSSIGAGATAWFGAGVKIGNSYSVEFKNTTGNGASPGTLTMLSGDEGCNPTGALNVRDTTSIDPGEGAASRRVSFTAAGLEPFARARLVNSGSTIPLSFSWSDTTMYSPAWTTNGAFETFYSFQNTTGLALSGVLTLFDTAGAVTSTLNLAIPGGQSASVNTQSLGTARQRTGTAQFTHDGPPGAVIGEAAIANFSLSPAYIQPVKFQAIREAR